MKRSEMLKKIKETLEGRIRQEDYAEEILKTVEDLGMIPPFSDKVFYKNWQATREQIGNEWEPEDEA